MNNINTLGDVIRILGRLNKVVDLKPINDSTRTDTQTWCILEFKCSDDEYREKLHSSLQNYIEAMSTLKNIEPSIRDEMVNLYSKNKLKEYDNLIIK